MKRIREWAFPAGLMLAWVIASVYTVSALVSANSAHQRFLNPISAESPRT